MLDEGRERQTSIWLKWFLRMTWWLSTHTHTHTKLCVDGNMFLSMQFQHPSVWGMCLQRRSPTHTICTKPDTSHVHLKPVGMTSDTSPFLIRAKSSNPTTCDVMNEEDEDDDDDVKARREASSGHGHTDLQAEWTGHWTLVQAVCCSCGYRMQKKLNLNSYTLQMKWVELISTVNQARSLAY